MVFAAGDLIFEFCQRLLLLYKSKENSVDKDLLLYQPYENSSGLKKQCFEWGKKMHNELNM